jgi:hypothetical protein
MANVDAPFGLRPLRYISGSPYMGACNTYYVPASDGTAIYLGQLVKRVNGGDANGVPAVTGNVATADTVVGVVVGVQPVTADSTIYRAASTARYVSVVDDPEVLFTIQEDSVGGALDEGDIGKYAVILTPTAGNTFTGLSSAELDSSDANVTQSTRALQILGLTPVEGNAIGDHAEWTVRLMNHERGA